MLDKHRQTTSNDRRQDCQRIIGIERRGAPIPRLNGHQLPDPTRLIDEDFPHEGEETSTRGVER